MTLKLIPHLLYPLIHPCPFYVFRYMQLICKNIFVKIFGIVLITDVHLYHKRRKWYTARNLTKADEK